MISWPNGMFIYPIEVTLYSADGVSVSGTIYAPPRTGEPLEIKNDFGDGVTSYTVNVEEVIATHYSDPSFDVLKSGWSLRIEEDEHLVFLIPGSTAITTNKKTFWQKLVDMFK